MHTRFWTKGGAAACLMLLGLTAVQAEDGVYRITDQDEIQQTNHTPYDVTDDGMEHAQMYRHRHFSHTPSPRPNRGYTYLGTVRQRTKHEGARKFQVAEYQWRARNHSASVDFGRKMRCGFRGLSPLFYWDIGSQSDIIPVNPQYTHPNDSQLWAAQGYGAPLSVPLAPVVRNTYNYSWGLPGSRLTPMYVPR